MNHIKDNGVIDKMMRLPLKFTNSNKYHSRIEKIEYINSIEPIRIVNSIILWCYSCFSFFFILFLFSCCVAVIQLVSIVCDRQTLAIPMKLLHGNSFLIPLSSKVQGVTDCLTSNFRRTNWKISALKVSRLWDTLYIYYSMYLM